MRRTPFDQLEAYSVRTGRQYENWDALLKAESNGYVIVITSDRPGTGPAVYGPYPDKHAVARVRVKLRNKAAKEERPFKVHTSVRVLWKEDV